MNDLTRPTTRRELIRLTALGAAGAALAACGGAPPGTPSAAPAGRPAPATTPGQAAAPVRVRFWYGIGGQLAEVIETQIKKFNAATPGVAVEGLLQKDYNGVQEKFQAALVGGDVPELIQMEIHATPQFAASGALAPIEPFYAGDATFNFDDLVPATLLNQRWEGKLYAMPINRSTPLLYYNKKLFKEAGLDPEQPTRTWSDFQAMARTLTRGDVYGYIPAADWSFFESMVWSNAGELIGKDLKTVTFAQPGAEVLQVWADMVHREKSARILSGESAGEQRQQDYIQGRGAFFINSTAGLGRFIREVKDFEIGTAFMPYARGGQPAVPTGGAAAAIPARLPPGRQRAAWEFVRWWISPEQAAFWSQNTGYFPVRKSSIEILTKAGYYQERPQFKTSIDQLQYAREAPLTPAWPAIAKEITKGMEASLVNGLPALEALTKAQERAQQILQG
jgi:ABC-type glycerol-3-phosphate transport system substrate-binding protein